MISGKNWLLFDIDNAAKGNPKLSRGGGKIIVNMIYDLTGNLVVGFMIKNGRFISSMADQVEDELEGLCLANKSKLESLKFI